ncbi:MAG: site-2 protease family protein [Pseudomonadota bacterium]|nr:site-2 protease family protein [Pseudomonadota bacterium]
MPMLHSLADFIVWLGWYIVPFIVVMNGIVFFHELGHYLVARWCGVKIEAFSLGFGPELLARVDSKGTRWRLALFPLGGYVKFLGDANAASGQDEQALASVDPVERGRTLAAQPVYNRAAIVAAGPAANFLLAMVLFTGLFYVFGQSSHNARIGFVEPGSPAAAAGFAPGDLVTAIDGQPIKTFQDLQQAVVLNTGIEMRFALDRDGKTLTLDAAPQIMLVDQGVLGKRRIGHLGLGATRDPKDVTFARCGLPQCVGWAGEQVSFITRATLSYIGGLFAGRESVDQMSGMVGMTQITGAIAKISLWELFNLAALFSVSVGLMNLFPIPLLDGGHLMFYLIEAVIGRPVSERVQQLGMRVGMALVGSLMIFTTAHDLLRLFGRG